MWLTSNRKLGLRHTLIMFGVSLFGLLFMIIYYANSRGMVSRYLNFIWLSPLLLSIAYALVCMVGSIDIGEWSRLALNAGTGTLMVYQAVAGIYDIALVRPENSIDAAWAVLFHWLGVVLIWIGIVLSVIYVLKKKKSSSQSGD